MSKYTREQIQEVVTKSFSVANVLRELGLVANGGNYKTVNKYIKLYDIDISHFTGKLWIKGKKLNYTKSIPLDKILVDGSDYQTHLLKKRLFNEDIKIKRCEVCNLNLWNNIEIRFELHHIDGNNTNNQLSNLQILCPNCHSQTRTHRGGNVKLKNENKLLEYKKSLEEFIHPIKQKTNKVIASKIRNCLNCSIEFTASSNTQKFCCHKCCQYAQVSKRPEKELLLEAINKIGLNFSALGREFDATDNAVRKWCRYYLISIPNKK